MLNQVYGKVLNLGPVWCLFEGNSQIPQDLADHPPRDV
jgi:hypothetical protein